MMPIKICQKRILRQQQDLIKTILDYKIAYGIRSLSATISVNFHEQKSDNKKDTTPPPKTAADLLAERDRRLREQPTTVPQCERGGPQ